MRFRWRHPLSPWHRVLEPSGGVYQVKRDWRIHNELSSPGQISIPCAWNAFIRE